MKHICLRILCLSVFIFNYLNGSGQLINYQVGFDFNEIAAYTSKDVEAKPCEGEVIEAYCCQEHLTKSVLKITLDLGNDYIYFGNTFDVSVEVTVTPFDNNCGAPTPLATPVQKTLNINQYTPEVTYLKIWEDGGGNPLDPGHYQVDVSLISSTLTTEMENDLRLIAIVEDEKKYLPFPFPNLEVSCGGNFPQLVTLDNISYPDGNPVTFSWEYDCEYESPEYQIQILRLFNTDPAKTTTTQITTEVDWSSALNLFTNSSATEIDLVMAEGTGYYVWRVRPIGDYYEGGPSNSRNYGAWSEHTGFETENSPIVINGANSPYLFYHNNQLGDKNWIYTRNFSEGSYSDQQQVKTMEQIVYANGLNQVQQLQSRNSTNDQVIVGQQIYDYNARAVIKGIPMPISGKSNFTYESMFMLNNSGDLYRDKDFDNDLNYEDPSPMRQLATDKTQYYSSANPDPRLPSADGYPYTITRYTEDNTGRLREQTQPGSTHKMTTTGEDHTTHVFYGGVCDDELVRVFGDEAPAGDNVTKSITVDVNEVASVNYIDEMGRTIATCLAINGKNLLDQSDNGSLEGLASQADAIFNVNQKINSRMQDGKYGHKTTKTIVVVEEQGVDVGFNYILNRESVTDFCLDPNFCHTCDYYLEITVYDVLENKVEHYWDELIDPEELCSNVPVWTWNNSGNNIHLDKGTWRFTKQIKAYNVDPATKGPNKVGEYFIEQQLEELRLEYETMINTDLGTIEGYLDDYDLEGLYDHLNVDFDAVPVPTSVNVTVGCEQMTIPVKTCEPNECPTDNSVDFASVFSEAWVGKEYDDVDGNNKLEYLDYKYTATEFNNMINNMFIDYGPTRCDDIWGCWQNVVHSYEILLDLQSQSQGKQPTYTVDVLDAFLTCVGRQFQGHTSTPYGTGAGVFGCSSGCNEGFLSHPYAYFETPNSSVSTPCLEAICVQNGSTPGNLGNCAVGTYPNSLPWSSTTWEDYYNCTKNYSSTTASTLTTSTGIASSKADAIAFCEKTCDNRRVSFERAVVRMFHSQQLLVEKDKYYLVLDQGYYNTWIPDKSSPLPASFNQNMDWDVCWSEVECLVNMMIDNCKAACVLDDILDPGTGGVIGYGTPQQLEDMGKAMTYSFEIELPSGGNCPAGPDWVNLSNPTACTNPPDPPMTALINLINTTSTSSTSGVKYITPGMLPPGLAILINGECVPMTNVGFVIDGDVVKVVTFNGTVVDQILCQETFLGLSSGSGTLYFDPVTYTLKFDVPGNDTRELACLQFCDRCILINQEDLINTNYYLASAGLIEFQYFPFQFDILLNGLCTPAGGYGLNITGNQLEWVHITAGVVDLVLCTEPIYDISAGGYIEFDEVTSQFVSKKSGSADMLLNCVEICCYLPGGITGQHPTIGNGQSGGYAGSCSTYGDVCFRWVEFPTSNINSLAHTFEPYTCEKVISIYLQDRIDYFRYEYIEKQVKAYKDQYFAKCTDPFAIDDDFEINFELGYHHYTLYYYDRAGNLVKTVPPEGVDMLDVDLPTVDDRSTSPTHKMETEYEYNSKKQLVRQKTPDGGETYFYYNQIGQLRFSQNQQQALDDVYSYSKYDELGRIIEVGQNSQDGSNPNVFASSTNLEDMSYPTQGSSYYTKTTYTEPTSSVSYMNDGLTKQRNLLNRVSKVKTLGPSFYVQPGLANYNSSVTYFSYDPHGNVEWMAIDQPGLTHEQRFYMAYEYDLFSGNVLKVKYNEGKVDQFYHRYHYDADNRITLVETSKDNVVWDRDADYDYYLHGPLKREGIGEDKIQGVDYTYTLHGWLKSINHASLIDEKDPGQDGYSGYFTASDVFGMQLNYFEDDFIKSGSPFANLADEHLEPGIKHDLYNGNISTWTSNTATNSFGAYNGLNGRRFKYDQLNRLTKSKFLSFNNSGSPLWSIQSDYYSEYVYDANGNIEELVRAGYDDSPTHNRDLDELSYTYDPTGESNKLISVEDMKVSNNFPGEFIGTANYTYDEIGNLISDPSEEIQNIIWTPSGKIQKIERTPGSLLPEIEFGYDAMGNRNVKFLTFKDASGILDERKTVVYSYVNDAQGNTMAIYKSKIDPSFENFENETDIFFESTLQEWNLYGSSRLGNFKADQPISRQYVNNVSYDVNNGRIDGPNATSSLAVESLIPTELYYRFIDLKQYELKDHLGNVRATIGDGKIQSFLDLVYHTFDYDEEGWTTVGSSVTAIQNSGTQELDISTNVLNSGAFITFSTLVGKTYNVELTIDNGSASQVNYEAFPNGGGTPYQTSTISSAGTYNFSFTALTTSTDLKVVNKVNSGSGVTFSVDDVEVNTSGFLADIKSANDYYPFGWVMPGRNANSDEYRYGFNDKEKDDEVKNNSGTQYNYGFRIYDPKVGRFLSVDPLTDSYPWYTPYQFAGNKPIWAIDLDGLEEFIIIRWYDSNGNYDGSTVIQVPNSDRITGYSEGILYLELDRSDENEKLSRNLLNNYSENHDKVYDQENDNFIHTAEYSKESKNNKDQKRIDYLLNRNGSFLRNPINNVVYTAVRQFDQNFKFDQSMVIPEQKLELVKKFLSENPDYKVFLTGHASFYGSNEYNMELSKKRVMEAAKIFTDAGVSADRIIIDWKGESEQKFENSENRDENKNQRVHVSFGVPKEE